MKRETILVMDFGGQYNQLIARRIRECNVYCEVRSYKMTIEEIKEMAPKGIIFTGGPNSVYEEGAIKCDPAILKLGIPVLGICYGAQTIADALGGTVSSATVKEYGKTPAKLNTSSKLFKGLEDENLVWMSHTDYIAKAPEGFTVAAHTQGCPVAAMEDAEHGIYAVQFHPEVEHTNRGRDILRNFAYEICGCSGDWTMKRYAADMIEAIRTQVGDKKVLLALSGGVDSSVCARLLSRAVGKQLTCIFVDHGFMRKNEPEEICETFGNDNINFVMVDARERFLDRLTGVEEPEEKRKRIGEEFIRVFEDEAKKIGKVEFFAQGTIYPDVIESGLGDSAVIKSHHNVGGLPEHVDFEEIIEPLRMLFKDEVRKLGRELELADVLVDRQPFPGPGLAIRIIGEVTKERLEVLRDADLIFREEIAKAGLDTSINQYFAVLTSMRSVGVMGDFRTYDYTLALRAVTTTDFMTADFARIPYDVLEKISVAIINNVSHINRIVYDITTKPPATIEWE